MKTVSTKLLALALAFILSGCSNSPDDEPSSKFDVYTFIDFGLTLQETLLGTYESDLMITGALVEDTYKVMDSVEQMADRVTTSRELSAEFINLLAKGQTFNEDYSSIFSTNSNYETTNTSYFTMNAFDDEKSYMLVSSSTRLFVPGTTIKTLFTDNSSLNSAWQRSLDNHQSGNMYLNIYEVKADGTVQRAGTPALIPSETVTSLQSTI